MKKTTQRLQVLGENKETNQAIVMIPMALMPDLKEFFDEDALDYKIALKRKNDPKRKLLSLSQTKKELGL